LRESPRSPIERGNSLPTTDRVHVVVDAMKRAMPTLDFSAKAVTARLVRLGVLFVEAIERAVAPFGLSANEYVILCVLRASGPAHTLPPKAINPLMNLTSGGMTNILHALERRGLIERLPDPSDRRGVLIKMTAPAKNLVEGAISAHVAEEQRMLTALSKREQAQLQDLLSKLLLDLDPDRRPASMSRDAARIQPTGRSAANRRRTRRMARHA
jgi:DNA-binding MarR family transcriptional regulator